MEHHDPLTTRFGMLRRAYTWQQRDQEFEDNVDADAHFLCKWSPVEQTIDDSGDAFWIKRWNMSMNDTMLRSKCL